MYSYFFCTRFSGNISPCYCISFSHPVYIMLQNHGGNHSSFIQPISESCDWNKYINRAILVPATPIAHRKVAVVDFLLLNSRSSDYAKLASTFLMRVIARLTCNMQSNLNHSRTTLNNAGHPLFRR